MPNDAILLCLIVDTHFTILVWMCDIYISYGKRDTFVKLLLKISELNFLFLAMQCFMAEWVYSYQLHDAFTSAKERTV